MLRCGVGTPKGYTRFAACQTANGVDWFVPDEAIHDQDTDVVMTTIGRSPSVEVVVPAEYRPPGRRHGRPRPAIKAHTRRDPPLQLRAATQRRPVSRSSASWTSRSTSSG